MVVNPEEAEQVRTLFSLYLEFGSLLPVLQEAQRRRLLTKRWTTEDGKVRGGQRINKGTLHGILTNAIYTGVVVHKGSLYPGEHERIIDQSTWDRIHETLRRNHGDKGASLRNKYGALLRGLALLRALRCADDSHLYDAEVEALPLLRLLQRPAAGLEELRDEVRSGPGNRIRGARRRPAHWDRPQTGRLQSLPRPSSKWRAAGGRSSRRRMPGGEPSAN
jgi:hypothetical protein